MDEVYDDPFGEEITNESISENLIKIREIEEIAGLLNDEILSFKSSLHEKYFKMLDDVGEIKNDEVIEYVKYIKDKIRNF